MKMDVFLKELKLHPVTTSLAVLPTFMLLAIILLRILHWL